MVKWQWLILVIPVTLVVGMILGRCGAVASPPPTPLATPTPEVVTWETPECEPMPAVPIVITPTPEPIEEPIIVISLEVPEELEYIFEDIPLPDQAWLADFSDGRGESALSFTFCSNLDAKPGPESEFPDYLPAKEYAFWNEGRFIPIIQDLVSREGWLFEGSPEVLVMDMGSWGVRWEEDESVTRFEFRTVGDLANRYSRLTVDLFKKEWPCPTAAMSYTFWSVQEEEESAG